VAAENFVGSFMIYFENLQGRDHLKELGEDGRMTKT
jgi:hypothetical protein